MIAIDVKLMILWVLFIILGSSLLAIYIDRQRFREPLLIRAGIHPGQIPHYFDSAPAGLLLLDRHLRPIYANPSSQHLLGIVPGQTLPLDTHWHKELEQDLLIAKQNPTHTHYRLLTLPDGLVMSWWICALPHFHLLLLTDMSDQHRLQKSTQTFLSNLSHELRTPLTAVLAHLEVVQNSKMDETIKHHSLNVVHQETQRLSRLVQDMLQLARLEISEEIEKRPINLLLVAEAAVAQMILTAESKNIDLSLEATPSLPRILGDTDKLRQVFLNILDNSLAHCRPGDQIKVHLLPESKGVRVHVFDTGPGIPPEHLPHLTERFYRVNHQTSGSGLGLAIVAEILRHHHATLEINSQNQEEPTSTTISFWLPAE